LEEFLGNKIEIDYDHKTAQFTQPVLLPSLKDEFVLKKNKTTLPASAGTILSYKNEGVKNLGAEKQVLESSYTWQSGQGQRLKTLFVNCQEE
jgi:hypothetical protein